MPVFENETKKWTGPDSINPELATLLKEWKENTPDRDEDIILNSIFAGFKNNDIAVMIGMSGRNVLNRYNRVVMKFQNVYEVFEDHFYKRFLKEKKK